MACAAMFTGCQRKRANERPPRRGATSVARAPAAAADIDETREPVQRNERHALDAVFSRSSP